MILQCHPQNPEKRIVQKIIDGLIDGKVYIVPTDTVYAFICHIENPRAISALYKIKSMSEKQPLSLLCRDISMAGLYTRNIPDYVFQFMKKNTPGPYTFILPASKEMDRRGMGRRKEVGIRIVDHVLHQALMQKLDLPIVSSSVRELEAFVTSPETLDNNYGHQVEAIIDGGPRKNEYTTILDAQSNQFKLVRQGIGDTSEIDYL